MLRQRLRRHLFALALGAGLLSLPACAGDEPRSGVAGIAATPVSTSASPATATAPAHPAGSWAATLDPPLAGEPMPVACFDLNGDDRINAVDSADLGDLDIPLVQPGACLPPNPRQEWFDAGDPPGDCRRPALAIVAIGGGGTDLLDTDQGVSAGLIDVVNGLRRRAAEQDLRTTVVLTTAAIDASDSPQLRMEEWLTADVARRLAQSPCLRVALMGHSHGAVVVTTVVARLEQVHGDRLYGVLLDRSLLYYDHVPDDLPVIAPILNVFQTNDGWHGDVIGTPNVTDVDVSHATAPEEPRDGPLPIVAVAHSTIDDAPEAQRIIVDSVAAWLAAP